VVALLGAISRLTMEYYPTEQVKPWRLEFSLVALIGFILLETPRFFADWRDEVHSLLASVYGGLPLKGSIFPSVID
jgi:hypothetical protein